MLKELAHIMSSPPADPAKPSRILYVLDAALDQSHVVQAEVEACADDLQQVTDNLARGVDEFTTVELALERSRAALADSEAAMYRAKQLGSPLEFFERPVDSSNASPCHTG